MRMFQWLIVAVGWWTKCQYWRTTNFPTPTEKKQKHSQRKDRYFASPIQMLERLNKCWRASTAWAYVISIKQICFATFGQDTPAYYLLIIRLIWVHCLSDSISVNIGSIDWSWLQLRWGSCLHSLRIQLAIQSGQFDEDQAFALSADSHPPFLSSQTTLPTRHHNHATALVKSQHSENRNKMFLLAFYAQNTSWLKPVPPYAQHRPSGYAHRP